MKVNAREMVGLGPDVILVKGASVPAARRATSTIPGPQMVRSRPGNAVQQLSPLGERTLR
jgi:hypothetical protein